MGHRDGPRGSPEVALDQERGEVLGEVALPGHKLGLHPGPRIQH